jgi:glucokinase
MRKSLHTSSISPSPGGGQGKAFTIGIDMGGTIIKIGLMKEGLLVDRVEIAAQSASGLKKQLPGLESAIDKLMKLNGLQPEEVLGIGFSFAGLVDSFQNRILSTNQKYDDGPETDLVGWAREKWGWPLFAMNDARMALLGEWQYGAGKGYTDIVMVTLGTGIGTAVLAGGKLLIGKHFQAGNLGGHFVVDHKGTICTCGNIGCVEAEASTWRLPSLLKEHQGFSASSMNKEKILDFKALFYHAGNNDKVANEVLDHCLSTWAAGIINMIHAFDPEMIILSGGLMKSSSIILQVLQEKIDRLAWTPWGKVKLAEAQYSDSAALYGAEYLVWSSLI